jgi:DNA polymerase elongation subunit (family B)
LQRKDADIIKKIVNLGKCSGYVYDIETENHHFAAGVGRLIVHNTDSSMIDLGIKDTKECNYWGNKLSEEISKLFPPPIKMEYEKGMRMLCLKKKKYAAFLVDKNGNLKTDRKNILVRGIILARRDTLPWLQNMYSELLYNVMMRQSMISSLGLVYQAVENITLEKMDVKGIVVVRQLGAYYKNENYFMNVFAKKLKALGHLVTPGDRLEYLIIKSDETLLGNRMITYDMYMEGGYKLDTLYYLDHMLKNPIDQLFSVGHKEELSHYEDLGFQTKRKFMSIKKPIAMVIEAFKHSATLEQIKEFMSV